MDLVLQDIQPAAYEIFLGTLGKPNELFYRSVMIIVSEIM